ncbi:MAG: DUF1820 family protein [Spirochaetales bacterium]|uniref:DUF1820 family protein n=1 Tax=Candidatus Thalassospirochaeta sargassi TaxID=3119039 RepID=A0AAJ1IFW9_9SPIO|nr:DUF1820 family protein [Spirochaetales bacterium]
MPIYRVHFKWNEKDLQLKAKSLDLTHPYFVSIKDLILAKESKLIIDPTEDEVRRLFGKADHLMIPFQTVSLIEEFKDDAFGDQPSKVMDFKLIEDSEN